MYNYERSFFFGPIICLQHPGNQQGYSLRNDGNVDVAMVSNQQLLIYRTEIEMVTVVDLHGFQPIERG